MPTAAQSQQLRGVGKEGDAGECWLSECKIFSLRWRTADPSARTKVLARDDKFIEHWPECKLTAPLAPIKLAFAELLS